MAEGQNSLEVSRSDGDGPTQLQLRQDLVETAVRFLCGDRVQSTPQTEQDAFLKSKGLTAAEIAEARRRAAGTVPTGPAAGHTGPVQLAGRPGGWVAGGGPSAVLLLAAATYAAYKLATRWVLPRLFGIVPAEEQRRQLAEQRAQQLTDSLQFVMDALERLIERTDKHDRALQQLTDTLQQNGLAPVEGGQVHRQLADMSNDMTVLKGLLLGRSQFAPAPLIAGNCANENLRGGRQAANSDSNLKCNSTADANVAPAPGPPAWQLAKSDSCEGSANELCASNGHESIE